MSQLGKFLKTDYNNPFYTIERMHMQAMEGLSVPVRTVAVFLNRCLALLSKYVCRSKRDKSGL